VAEFGKAKLKDIVNLNVIYKGTTHNHPDQEPIIGIALPSRNVDQRHGSVVVMQ
jgi:hypothetical protein